MDPTGAGWIAGADEVGRGALAGPVYAAAVVFAPGRKMRGLDDSTLARPHQNRCALETSTGTLMSR